MGRVLLTACGFEIGDNPAREELVDLFRAAKNGEVDLDPHGPEAFEAMKWLRANCMNSSEGATASLVCPLPDGKRHVSRAELGNVGKLVAHVVCSTKGNDYPSRGTDIKDPAMKQAADVAIAKIWEVVKPWIKECEEFCIYQIKKVCVCVCVCVHVYASVCTCACVFAHDFIHANYVQQMYK